MLVVALLVKYLSCSSSSSPGSPGSPGSPVRVRVSDKIKLMICLLKKLLSRIGRFGSQMRERISWVWYLL